MLGLNLLAELPEWKGTAVCGSVWICGGLSRTRPLMLRRTPQARGATESQLIIEENGSYV